MSNPDEIVNYLYSTYRGSDAEVRSSEGYLNEHASSDSFFPILIAIASDPNRDLSVRMAAILYLSNCERRFHEYPIIQNNIPGIVSILSLEVPELFRVIKILSNNLVGCLGTQEIWPSCAEDICLLASKGSSSSIFLLYSLSKVLTYAIRSTDDIYECIVQNVLPQLPSPPTVYHLALLYGSLHKLFINRNGRFIQGNVIGEFIQSLPSVFSFIESPYFLILHKKSLLFAASIILNSPPEIYQEFQTILFRFAFFDCEYKPKSIGALIVLSECIIKRYHEKITEELINSLLSFIMPKIASIIEPSEAIDNREIGRRNSCSSLISNPIASYCSLLGEFNDEGVSDMLFQYFLQFCNQSFGEKLFFTAVYSISIFAGYVSDAELSRFSNYMLSFSHSETILECLFVLGSNQKCAELPIEYLDIAIVAALHGEGTARDFAMSAIAIQLPIHYKSLSKESIDSLGTNYVRLIEVASECLNESTIFAINDLLIPLWDAIFQNIEEVICSLFNFFHAVSSSKQRSISQNDGVICNMIGNIVERLPSNMSQESIGEIIQWITKSLPSLQYGESADNLLNLLYKCIKYIPYIGNICYEIAAFLINISAESNFISFSDILPILIVIAWRCRCCADQMELISKLSQYSVGMMETYTDEQDVWMASSQLYASCLMASNGEICQNYQEILETLLSYLEPVQMSINSYYAISFVLMYYHQELLSNENVFEHLFVDNIYKFGTFPSYNAFVLQCISNFPKEKIAFAVSHAMKIIDKGSSEEEECQDDEVFKLQWFDEQEIRAKYDCLKK